MESFNTFLVQLLIIVVMALLRKVVYEVIELVIVVIDQSNELLKRRVVDWVNSKSNTTI